MSPSVFVWNKHFKRSIPGGKNTDLTEACAKDDLSRSNSQQSALSWNWISSTRHNICKRFPAYYINITDMKPHLYSWRVRSRGHLVRRKWWAQNIVDLPIASAENHSSKTVLLLLSLVKMGLDNLFCRTGPWFVSVSVPTHEFWDVKVCTNVNSIQPTQHLCMHPAPLVFVLILSQGATPPSQPRAP